jgi:hypothetical protein
VYYGSNNNDAPLLYVENGSLTDTGFNWYGWSTSSTTSPTTKTNLRVVNDTRVGEDFGPSSLNPGTYYLWINVTTPYYKDFIQWGPDITNWSDVSHAPFRYVTGVPCITLIYKVIINPVIPEITSFSLGDSYPNTGCGGYTATNSFELLTT